MTNNQIKVIKKVNTPPEKLRRHAIGMLKELIAMYPKEAADIVRNFRVKITE
jgi:hypothetical protein